MMKKGDLMADEPTFETLNLAPELLAGLRRKGFRQPTPIQALVIPEVPKGRDLIVQAQTGSGKTLAFGLPLLQREPVDERAPSVLVVSPTRELAKQIRAELTSVSGTLPRRIVVVSGGESLDKQVDQLKRGAHVLVGTPGRLVDLLERGALNLKHVQVLVLDEADEILAKGFEQELVTLTSRMPQVKQTLLFSATMPAAVQKLADATLRKPHRIKVAAAPETPPEIDHYLLEVAEDTQVEALAAWLTKERPFMTMVFCRTRAETEWLSDELGKRGFDNAYLSGELSQAKRTRILERFRSGDLPLLIATDLAARGIDVPGVTHVVNLSVPSALETYVHRTGRTGRAGRKGIALTLATPGERNKVQAIRKVVDLKAWGGLRVEGLPKATPRSTSRLSKSRSAGQGAPTRKEGSAAGSSGRQAGAKAPARGKPAGPAKDKPGKSAAAGKTGVGPSKGRSGNNPAKAKPGNGPAKGNAGPSGPAKGKPGGSRKR